VVALKMMLYGAEKSEVLFAALSEELKAWAIEILVRPSLKAVN
jgi:hypothetical protein